MSQATLAVLGTHHGSTTTRYAKGEANALSLPPAALHSRCHALTSEPHVWGRNMRALRSMLLLFACAFATGATAQYPDKPIRLIVPQAAGSATDTVARILGAELGKEFGQQIVVDNRPGGALTIGLDLTAKAEPDGYTICMGPIGALAITRHMVAKLPYGHRAGLPADRARDPRTSSARG